MSFTDDFNRADGPVDNGWTDLGDACTISGGYPTSIGNALIVRTYTGASGAQDVTVAFDRGANTGWSSPVIVKHDGSTANYYEASINAAGANAYARIFRVDSGTPTLLDESDYIQGLGSTFTLELSYDGGALTLKVDGATVASASDSTHSDHAYFGLASPNLIIKTDSITATYADPPYLDLSPSEVYVAAPATYIAATLHNDTWSGPFPGAGTLTADHGWIIVQNRDTSTLTTFSYQAMGYVGVVTITDTDTGATGTFTVTSFPVTINGDSWPLTEDGAGLINNGDATCQDAAILTTCTPIDAGNTVNIPKGIDAILEQLSGFYGQTGADIGTDGRPNNVHIPWKKAGLSEWYTIDNVLGLLGGSPTLYSHADLRTDLSNAISLDTTTITDLVNALSDGPDGDLFKILQQIAYLRTVEGYTLGTVKAWIEAIPPTDLTAITDKLDLIQPSTAADLTTLTNQITGVDNVVDAINGVLGVVTDGGTLTLQMILDAISALSDLVSALSPKTAPVWPSLAEVTLGTPVAFDGNVDVTAPMDGVLVNLTQSPTKTGHYALGNVDLWYGLGRIAFESDNGDVEPWQYLAYDNGLFAPKSMQHASAAHLQVLGGAEGTVTPWTITPPAPAPAVRTAKYSYRFDDDDPAGG